MENKYLELEETFRTLVSLFENITWAKQGDKNLLVPYKKLVDIFGNRLGNNLSNDEKNDLVKTMIRNSGYSNNSNGCEKETPVTLFDSLGRGKNYHVAVCVYPLNAEFSTHMHEGTHFLGKHGAKEKRIIKENKDVPLANIIGTFFKLRKNPENLKEIVGTTDENQVTSLEQNPFLFNYDEHSKEEHFEAGITAAKAYFIAKRQGEKAGINHIVSLMEEAMLRKT